MGFLRKVGAHVPRIPLHHKMFYAGAGAAFGHHMFARTVEHVFLYIHDTISHVGATRYTIPVALVVLVIVATRWYRNRNGKVVKDTTTTVTVVPLSTTEPVNKATLDDILERMSK